MHGAGGRNAKFVTWRRCLFTWCGRPRWISQIYQVFRANPKLGLAVIALIAHRVCVGVRDIISFLLVFRLKRRSDAVVTSGAEEGASKCWVTNTILFNWHTTCVVIRGSAVRFIVSHRPED